MKTATVAAAFVALALSPASAQSPGDQLTCIGRLFNNDVFPPNRIVEYVILDVRSVVKLDAWPHTRTGD